MAKPLRNSVKLPNKQSEEMAKEVRESGTHFAVKLNNFEFPKQTGSLIHTALYQESRESEGPLGVQGRSISKERLSNYNSALQIRELKDA